MANFEGIVNWVLEIEDARIKKELADPSNKGEIVNLGDGAGLTRLGITSNNHGADVPADFFTTMDTATAITWAKKVYREKYWNQIRGDEIAGDQIAAPLMSWGVNRGMSKVIKVLQTILAVNADGVLGPQTLAILNTKDPAITGKLFRAEWENWIHRHVDAEPGDARFMHEWIYRARLPYPNPSNLQVAA